jgi:hypothetical protein
MCQNIAGIPSSRCRLSHNKLGGNHNTALFRIGIVNAPKKRFERRTRN